MDSKMHTILTKLDYIEIKIYEFIARLDKLINDGEQHDTK